MSIYNTHTLGAYEIYTNLHAGLCTCVNIHVAPLMYNITTVYIYTYICVYICSYICKYTYITNWSANIEYICEHLHTLWGNFVPNIVFDMLTRSSFHKKTFHMGIWALVVKKRM